MKITAFIVIGALTRGEADIKSYGGENTHEIIDPTDSAHTLGHYLKELGIFKSIGEARRNNWDKVIDEGYNYFTIGKLRHEVHILKITSRHEHADYFRGEIA